MKNKLLKAFYILGFSVLFSSCAAYHSGYMTNSASLSSKNFIYVYQGIAGWSTATYILGVGGIAKETLVDDAKANLLSGHKLRDNQALSNITVNFKTSSYVGVYVTVRCTVTADVVEFTK